MNKFLVTFIVPELDMEFEIYIPNNKKIGTIKKYFLKTLNEQTNNMYHKDVNQVVVIDKQTGKKYLNDIYVKDTDIKNGSKLIFI